MTALILYFSGTGNTKSVAEDIKSCLIKRNLTVIMHSIEENIDWANLSYDYLIVGFPKYYEYPILFMLDYLKQHLPKQEKPIPTMAFCTQASPLKTDFTGLERLLRKKNHNLTVGVSLPYANNMVIFQGYRTTEPDELLKNWQAIRDRIDSLLDTFLGGKESKEQIKAWQRPLYYMVAVACTKLMPLFAMRFSANESCVHCGLCARQCPAKNIKVEQGRPVFQKHCMFCMRCINSCPVNAILYNKKKCRQYTCNPQPSEKLPSASKDAE